MSTIVHIASRKLYFTIFAALMVLTAATVWVATVDLGPLNDVVMLTVAVAKATLVVLYFMHVRWNTPLVKVTIWSALVFLIVLFVLTLSDFLSRHWDRLSPGW